MNLKRLRRARGYTQEQLGKLLGLDRRYISGIEQERVNITLANLERLAKGLQCSFNDLFAPAAPETEDAEESQAEFRDPVAAGDQSQTAPCSQGLYPDGTGSPLGSRQ